VDICTIIAKNYVAQARVLASSFAEHHPDGRCFALVIDDYEGYIDPRAEPFTILTPAQVGCSEFDDMVLRYTVLELSTAVKPWLLAHLLSEGCPAITYLDPDIRVYSSLEQLDQLAREHGVVLTPHNVEPLPDDGERPSQVDILLAGVYNLGYVSLGVGSEIDTLLGWWRDRLLRDCRVDPLNGYFVDQRWFDLAPGLVSDHVIVREPQYNLAYWNLHSHRLESDGAQYTVDGVPLAFYHFSGFDPERPDVLSRHQTRVRIGAGSALARICVQYASELDDAGYTEAKDWPYTFDLLPSGIKYSHLLRRLYVAGAKEQAVSGSPFTPSGEQELLRWISSPAPGGPAGVSRVLVELYRSRPDLQEAYTDLHRDSSGFQRWVTESGVIEEPVLAALPLGLEDVPASAPSADVADGAGAEVQPTVGETARAELAWGVNVVGYFRSELGTGEAARQVVSALDARGIPLLPVHGRTIPPNRQGHAFTHLDYTDARYPVNLICMNADVLGEFATQAGAKFFDTRYSIGMWFWEVERFPEIWLSAFDHVDELWLPTEHVIRAIRPVSSVPITKITLPVEMPPVRPASRAELSLPEGFMFLFSFDYHSVFQRKNPLGVIEAYTRNFDPADGAVLVLKSINADSAPDAHAQLLAAAGGRPDVHILDEYLGPEHKNLFMGACDCYVSLHRAEGFGLTMAEAMHLGKPVIATGYSGNLDFMTKDNSFLVDYRLVQIGLGSEPYPPDARWAEPDIDHAGRLMREVFEHPHQAAERGRQAADDIRRTHSAAAAAEIMGRRLDLLRERHGGRLATAAESVSLTALVDRRVRTGPPPAAQSRLGRPRSLARRVLLRALKPFTAHQKSIDEDIARSLHSAEARLHDLEIRTTERHAMVLAGLRNDPSRRALWERIDGLTRSTVALESTTAELQHAIGDLPQRVDEMSRSLQQMQWESHALPFMEDSPFREIEQQQAGLTQGYCSDSDIQGDEVYRSFEDTFRGAEEFIRDRQRVFLDLVGDRAPVLDLGCGRGEFLDLLAERGIPCMGVDSDPGMVRRCHEKGHAQVVQGDGLEYLDALADASLGVLFCAQVIEHLPYQALLRLFKLAREKVSADGVFIAETVNPHSAPALKTFWVDLTHQHPIFPEVALSLCRASGFPAAFVFHPNGIGDIERDRFTQGEYAVVAGGARLFASRTLGQGLALSDGKRVDARSTPLALGGRVEPAVEPKSGN
jgi:glycosyltransferase involved in cell wall biosynthesis/SAM-dependent methyltransferase